LQPGIYHHPALTNAFNAPDLFHIQWLWFSRYILGLCDIRQAQPGGPIMADTEDYSTLQDRARKKLEATWGRS
jgi:hypothetical protein